MQLTHETQVQILSHLASECAVSIEIVIYVVRDWVTLKHTLLKDSVVFRLEPTMLKILPIIPSRNSPKLLPLFFFLILYLTYYFHYYAHSSF